MENTPVMSRPIAPSPCSVALAFEQRRTALTMVAPSFGYSNPAAFARVFTRRVGLSPSDWVAAHTRR